MALIDGLISQWLANNNGDDSINGHDMSSVSPSGYSVDAQLGSHALIYDSIDDKSVIPDHDDFSFGNISNDSPFSIFQWVKMTDATRFRLFYKNVNTLNAEYAFTTDSADKLTIGLYDVTTGNRIQRNSTATLTGFQGSYVLVGFTYPGNSSHAGLKLYVNDQRITTVNASGGSYTAMHAGAGDVWLGAGQFGGFANGLIDTTYIWSRDITDGGIAEGSTIGAGSDIDLLWNGGAGIEITEGGIILPRKGLGRGLNRGLGRGL